MKSEEVLRMFSQKKEWYENDAPIDFDSWIAAEQILYDAVKKQVPRKPIRPVAGDYCYKCSVCESYVMTADSYCRVCGNAIDWGKNEYFINNYRI